MGMLPPQASEQAYIDQKQNGREVEKQHCYDFYRKKQSIRPFFLTTTVNPVPVPAGVGQTAVATLDIGQEADFNVQKIACLVSRAGGAPARQDDFTFRIIDTRKGVAMSNVQIHNLCGTGTGLFPFILPDPYWFPRASSIQIEMTNRTAVALNVFWSFTGSNYYYREFENLTNTPNWERLSAGAKQYFVASQRKYLNPRFLGLDQTSINVGPGATVVDVPITIGQEGDFEAMAITSFSTAQYTFQLRESNTGRFLTSGAMSSATVTGDGERPWLFSETLLLGSNSQLFVTFTNLDLVNTNTIFFTLIGREWFDTASMNLTAGPDFYFDKYNQSVV